MYPMYDSQVHAEYRNSEMLRAAEHERLVRELRAIRQREPAEPASPRVRVRPLALVRLLRRLRPA